MRRSHSRTASASRGVISGNSGSLPTAVEIFHERAHFLPGARITLNRRLDAIDAEGIVRRVGVRAHLESGGDADLRHVDAVQCIGEVRRGEKEHRGRLERRADRLFFLAFDFERSGHDAAQHRATSPISRPAPRRAIPPAASRKASDERSCLSPGKRASHTSSQVKHRIGANQVTRQWKSWSKTVRQARRRSDAIRIAIERVLADIEIEGRQIDVHEILQRMEHAPEIIFARSPEHGLMRASASLCRM